MSNNISFHVVSGLIQAERVVDKIDIHYEKFAKRVDVKKLKESIWDTMSVNIPETLQDSTEDALASEMEINEGPIDTSFDTVVQEVAPKVMCTWLKSSLYIFI